MMLFPKNWKKQKARLKKRVAPSKNALHTATTTAEEPDDFAAKIAAAYKKLKKEAK